MDIAFLRLFKNDFEAAQRGDDTQAVMIAKNAYIQQKTNETFYVITNSLTSIAFAGSIKVELVDECDTVKADISDRFFYDTFVKDGINQLSFEFGMVNKDFYNTALFLKITDQVNGNIFYSNAFLVTDYFELSTRFEFTSQNRFRGTAYDLNPGYQTIRFANCYRQDDAGKNNSSEYTNTFGGITSFRATRTPGDKYIFKKFDIAIAKRIDEMLNHPVVYANGERIVRMEFKPGPIQGDTNFKTAEITLSPKEEYLSVGYQLFEPFEIVNFTPSGAYTTPGFPNDIEFSFNKASILKTGTLKIFNTSNVLIATFTESDISFSAGVYTIDNSAFVTTLADYYVFISEGLFESTGGEKFKVEDTAKLPFSIVAPDYSSSDYSSDYRRN